MLLLWGLSGPRRGRVAGGGLCVSICLSVCCGGGRAAGEGGGWKPETVWISCGSAAWPCAVRSGSGQLPPCRTVTVRLGVLDAVTGEYATAFGAWQQGRPLGIRGDAWPPHTHGSATECSRLASDCCQGSRCNDTHTVWGTLGKVCTGASPCVTESRHR
jgi:hypothetical protein